MMVQIDGLLSAEQVQQFRHTLQQARWVDGRATAGHQAARAKRNLQLQPGSPEAVKLGEAVLAALGPNSTFMAAALPLKVAPPGFNRYEGGSEYEEHIDSAVLSVGNGTHRVRSDISATLFLSEPAEYEGGELVVLDSFGEHRVKLSAGSLVLYPASSLHRVGPVTRGVRLASFFWIQSLVRQDAQRSLLWDLDQAIQRLRQTGADDKAVGHLLGVYHNLLRQWTDT